MKAKLQKVVWAGIVCMVLAGVVAAILCLPEPDNTDIKKSLEETRQSLRQQGFKMDLSDFDFSIPADVQRRAEDLVNSGQSLPPELRQTRLNRMPLTEKDAVVVLWREEWMMATTTQGEGLVHWSDLRQALDGNQSALDEVCAAAISGPIQFPQNPRAGGAARMPYFGQINSLESLLADRMVLDLHDGHPDAAWTNLLAATCLATAWEPNATQISYLIRGSMAASAFNATWQAMQHRGWTEEQLATLQRNWESVDFFTNLAETVAFTRVFLVTGMEQDRIRPAGSGVAWPYILQSAIHSPVGAMEAIRQQLKDAKYRSYGTYDDEKHMMLLYRDREVDMKNALKAPTWEQMRGLPGVTNQIAFVSPYTSRWQVSFSGVSVAGGGGLRSDSGLLERTAMAETQRRILITALALERYHLRHGSYPATLAGLAPDFLKVVPDDFMDGKPLRYRLTDDGHFVLYSVGLDCVDDGGKISPPPVGRPVRGLLGSFAAMDGDIVWPRPATAEETEAVREQSRTGIAAMAEEAETRTTAFQWSESDRRQANVEQILAGKRTSLGNGPDFHGHPLAAVLQNEASTGTNHLSLEEMFTLKQVFTGDEPEKVTFEVPMAYDTVTNLGSLALYIDALGKITVEGFDVRQMECRRATNGDCLLVWSTIFESPGKHALQLALNLPETLPGNPEWRGPPLAFTVTNLCQFAIASASFEAVAGATFHARLPEKNATYSIDCNLPDGTHLKTLTGDTMNGEFKITWDLKDDHGQRMTNEFFNSVVHLKLTDSGRTQTLQGP